MSRVSWGGGLPSWTWEGAVVQSSEGNKADRGELAAMMLQSV